MGDEDDYMGDLSRFLDPKLLQQSAEKKAKAPAPTAAPDNNHKKKGKGKQNWLDKRKESRDRARKTETEQLKEGLETAIPSSNIGFKMLQQMGYKPGAALGKHGQGAIEPIKLNLKQSRTGLGVDEIERAAKAKKVRHLELQQELKRKVEDMSQRDFRDRQRSSWQAGKVSRDYKRASAALAQLEESAGIKQEVKAEVDTVDGDKEEEEEETVTEEDLFSILEDLRSRFHYCIYCGCKYDSEAEMDASCPGFDEDAH